MGAGVNAVATMSNGFSGLTAMFGSLSWPLLLLSDLGIMLTMWMMLTAPGSRIRG